MKKISNCYNNNTFSAEYQSQIHNLTQKFGKGKIMNAIGIICELNPPHAGHKLLFDFAREKAKEHAIVAVMSGNFVQRGEPAVFPKHRRADAALLAGADLVLELPLPYALSSAEGFASAGVAILRATGIVDTLAFGAECGDLAQLKRIAEAFARPEFEQLIRDELKNGRSYAQACQTALEGTLDGDAAGAAVLQSPNNMLGIQYLRAINSCGDDGAGATIPVSADSSGGNGSFCGIKMDAICLKREPGITASGLRGAIRDGKEAPENLLPAKDYGEPIFPEHLEIAMLSRIRALTEAEFHKAPGGTDGIAERALRLCGSAGSISELAQIIKTKRHTLSRVRRYLMCLALGITSDCPKLPPYLRVLGANEAGHAMLKSMNATLPVITKPADGRKLGGEVARLLELEAAATDFYNLGYKAPELRRGGAEWRISPVSL